MRQSAFHSEKWLQKVLNFAVGQANKSPCQKSKRGAVIFNNYAIYTSGEAGFNALPKPLLCDGKTCRDICSTVAVHAEESAIYDSRTFDLRQFEILHIKTVNGEPVPSGPPSCLLCSKQILHSGLKGIWLLHEDGLKFYPAFEFHKLTLQHHGFELEPCVVGTFHIVEALSR